ncbi:PVC-type heme-binding CxxCH protein [Larkinella soli]|uniref:PVC-type heme-binding CxxCH protein n=1 Tax=Larkinella soli TaxID=1770527 RepID=UPI000FFC8934|nr:PVC-type heme-binding CxxCH protein [Larkinella soli]
MTFPKTPLLLLTLAFLLAYVPRKSGKPVKPVDIRVPEGYSVEVAAGPDLIDYPMFATLDETGRMFVFESIGHVYKKTKDALDNPQFRINLLQDTNGDGVYDKSTIYADKVGFPQGGVFYKGSLYATSAPDLLKFTDTDGDGVADRREVLLTGWTLNVNANSLIGPFAGPDGWLYMTSAITGFNVRTKEGKQLKGRTARIWRVRPDGSGLEWIAAGGMNNPVELTFTEAGEPIGTETYFTDPQAGQRDALVYWTEGGVYPKPHRNIGFDSLTRTGDLMPVVSKFSRVAPSGIGRYRHTALGEDFRDNLFSAQFNTHRVLRHKLIREGGSFRTEDQVFFATGNEDFHPTDVLEDADGSLLVVETGGWFIEGCPLSQVSKPELQGSIYRVRRTGAAKPSDPYGNRIDWRTLNTAKTISYLTDARPFVRDRAVGRLVDLGPAAMVALTEVLRRSPSAEARTKAVFALYRIGSGPAMASVRSGLNDAEVSVRVAAARSLGLAHDQAAVGRLSELILKDDPAVRRQAATALGQIGDARAVTALLAAAEKTDDRFVRHGIIYSLITLNQPQKVEAALAHSSPKVREAALIALDQMEDSPLRADRLTPFLAGTDRNLQATALWVASHHPDWAPDMAAFLKKRFQGAALTADEEKLYGDVLVSFSGNPEMQQFMAEQLEGASKERKLFLLNAMSRLPGEKFPAVWTEPVGRQLAPDNEPEVKARAIELVGLRNITSLAGPLSRLADDDRNPAGLRLQSLGALLKAQPELTDYRFAFLFDQLRNGKEAGIRQQAAGVLTQGRLSESQLAELSRNYLPKADAFLLPRLLPAFRGAHSDEVGTALATALAGSPTLDSFSEEALKTTFAGYSDAVRPAVDRLLDKLRQAQANRLQRLQALQKSLVKGDLERGRVLFFGKAVCGTCHKVGADGGKLGPDLTSIQRDRSAHDLMEAIVYPSVSFVREYEPYRVRTRQAEYVGIVQENSPSAIVLGTSPQTSVRVPRGEVTSMELQDTSLMPQGLDQLLTTQELSDLMAFLLGQDQDPATDQAILR